LEIIDREYFPAFKYLWCLLAPVEEACGRFSIIRT
jgi:hypothetical protein